MKLYCKELKLKLELKQSLLEKLFELGLQHYPKEFGGLLVGYYSDDFKTCFVEEAIIPKKFKSSRFHFDRGKDGLKKKLSELYNLTPRLIYIGEWHTHPDGVPSPSKTDLNAMTEIANCDEVSIENPILMILSNSKSDNGLGVFVFSNNKLIKYD